MIILNSIITLVSETPGNFVYHVIILFALESGLALSIRYHRLMPESDFGRFALASGVVLVMRMFFVVLVILGVFDIIEGAYLLPPLDRAISFFSLLVIGWALLSRPDDMRGDIYLSVGSIFIVIVTIVALIFWRSSSLDLIDFNNSDHDLFWTAPQVGLILGVLVLLLWRRPIDWDFGLGIFVIALLGTLLHLGFSLTTQILSGYISAFTRITDLVVFPMFVLIIYRRVLDSNLVVVNDVTDSSLFVPLLDSPVDPGLSPHIVRTIASIGVETKQNSAIQSVSRGVGVALGAEIGLLWELDTDDQSIRCMGGYDLLRNRTVVDFILPASQLEKIASVLNGQALLRLDPILDEMELQLLANQVGLQYLSPALVALIPSDLELNKAIMVLSPDSLSDWSESDQQMLLALLDPIARTLENIVDYH